MLSKAIRRRLRDLDRQGGGPVEPSAPLRNDAPGPGEIEERVVLAQACVTPRPPPPPPPSGTLEELAPGNTLATDHGSLYVIEASPADVLPGAARIMDEMARLMAAPPEGDDDPLQLLRGVNVSDLALLDTETAGLSAAPVFMVGLVLWPTDELTDARVLQLVARDYSQERAMLAETARLLAGRRVLMTYNGRSFDMPMLRERSVYHGLPTLTEPAEHLDLLHPVRKRFRGQWENCKLQTLETRLCGRERWGDIEGAAIPQAYHDFVRDGDAGRIKLVLEHNRLDLLTMLEVLPFLDGPADVPHKG